VEENDDIAWVWRAQIPLLFFKGGQLVDKFVGAASKSKIEEKFKALL
jgi:thioredoxin 1